MEKLKNYDHPNHQIPIKDVPMSKKQKSEQEQHQEQQQEQQQEQAKAA